MRRVPGTRAQVHEPRLVRRGRAVIAQEADGVVGQIFRQVIALFGAGRGVDRLVVPHQGGKPLVGHPVEETVEPVEPAAQRPVPAGAGGLAVLDRCQMPLPDGVGRPAPLRQHLGQQRRFRRDAAVVSGEAVGQVEHRGHSDAGRVAARQQCGPGGGTQCCGVELGQPQSTVGDPTDIRHLDQAAVAVPGGDPGVIPQQVEHIGRACRRLRSEVRRPVRRGLPDVDRNLTAEAHRCHRSSVLDSRAGIEDAVRVQRVLDPPVEFHRLRPELAGQPGPLEPPDAVLAGDGAAERRRPGP